MPLYEFSCDFCERTEDMHFKIAECPSSYPCMECKIGNMVKCISTPALHTDEKAAGWLKDAAHNLSAMHRDRKVNFETRQQFKQYLKDNPHIRPCSSGINRDEV